MKHPMVPTHKKGQGSKTAEGTRRKKQPQIDMSLAQQIKNSYSNLPVPIIENKRGSNNMNNTSHTQMKNYTDKFITVQTSFENS